MKQWVILKNTGEIQGQVYSDVHPSMNATRAWDATWKAYEVPRFGDLARETFVVGTGWKTDLGLVKTRLLAQVDADRETNQMAALTAGGAKKYVYNRKAAEAIDARTVLASVLNALSLTDKQKRFPFAYAEMLTTGDTLTVVLARFEAGLAASSTKIAVIEAQAQKAKQAVRSAATETACVAAANVPWTTA